MFFVAFASFAGAFVPVAKGPRLAVNYMAPLPLKKLTEKYVQKEPEDLED